MSSRRWWVWVLVVTGAVAALVVAVAVWGGDDEVDTASPDATSTSSSSSPPTTSTSTTGSSTSTSTTTTESAAVPGRVTVVRAGPGGGSGEVAVDWDAVAGATGYRVLRSATSGGPWVTSARLDVTNGTVSAEPEVVNLWSDQHTYVPSRGAFSGPDTSAQLHYVEVAGVGERCFLVVAFNAAGDGPESSAVCGSPP